MEKKRIEWVDIYKALGIILVVVGHATGAFNNYIYQFHMAAFFFISGYTTNFDRDSAVHYVYKKIYSLYIPLLFLTIMGAALMAILNATSVYSVFYNGGYIGFIDTIKNFVCEGANYVWWLGATWFILVLMQVEICQRIIYMICGNKNGILYAVFSLSLFVFGYFCVENSLFNAINLVFIGQGFFATGQIMRSGKKIDDISTGKLVGIGVAVCGYLYFAQKYFDATVDYPSKKFGNIVLNYCSGVLGSLLLIVISCCLVKLLNDRMKKPLIEIGKNTFGILVFHFMAFKILFLILAKLGIITMQEVQLTTPADSIKKYWLLITLYSIIFSMMLWNILYKNNIINIILGRKSFWEDLWNRKLSKRKISIDSRKIKHNIKAEKLSLVIGGTICLIIWGFMTYDYYVSSRFLEITFPYKENSKVLFDEGWLPQGSENYRWILKKGTVQVKKGNWNHISVSGYVPDRFSNVTQIEILVGSKEVYEKDLTNEREWTATVNISDECKKGDLLELEIRFNDAYYPKADEDDQRIMSGLVNEIQFK